MQTFLPYPDFARSAAVLDIRRLGKQRIETLQVLRGLTLPGYGWRHHPAVKMWANRTEALIRYGLEICAAWTARGYTDTVEAMLLEPQGVPRSQADLAAAGALPVWLGREDVHASHRSALLRKDPDFYGAVFTDVPDDLPYVWPPPSPAEAVDE